MVLPLLDLNNGIYPPAKDLFEGSSLQGREPAAGRSGWGRLTDSTEIRFPSEPI